MSKRNKSNTSSQVNRPGESLGFMQPSIGVGNTFKMPEASITNMLGARGTSRDNRANNDDAQMFKKLLGSMPQNDSLLPSQNMQPYADIFKS